MFGDDFEEGKWQTATIEELEKTLNHGTTQKANFDEGSSDESSADSEDDPGAHICCLTSEDIRSVVNLPVDHPVRSVVAQASIREFFSSKNHLFAKEIRQIPRFAADHLVAARQVLRGLRYDRSGKF
ncbi:hypothetical protein N7463_006509 [Penicillium fimorum]|uniref:Uncharacterized protein n=1 Tax=Penicillium fimorum TaxID=1882269 RepID=A0A9W9XUJ5_9EURO|nr:hypothetical protein N7463_006509 [Penicillium fimorum]